MSWILLLLACAPDPDELACRSDFSRASDGHCYPNDVGADEPLTTGDLLELLAPCTGLRPSERMDLDSGCAGGLCEGDLYDVATAVLGDPVACLVSSGDAFCRWRNGIEGRWDDDDGNGVPDPGSRNQRTHVEFPFVSGTADGLGIRMPPSCFVDVLGEPHELIVIDPTQGLAVQKLDFDRYGLTVYDFYDLDFRPTPDGLIDDLYLYGLP